jgi:spectinomycin phosphotransferase
VIAEPTGLPAERVAAVVREEWGVEVDSAEHLAVGADGWHWRIVDEVGPAWFATVDAVRTSDERRRLLAAYEATSELGSRLAFVVPPVRTRDARVAVDVAPGLLLSLTPYLEGRAGPGPFDDDADRGRVAGLLGDLHRHPRPRHLPVWRPRIGRHAHAGREELERCLSATGWSGGPWSGPAERLVVDARAVLTRAIRRFLLLGAAVVGSVDQWVVTHGEPHTGNLISTPDGARLVDWSTVLLAPRERDLREALGGAEGDAPWFAYVEAGGRPAPLSPDTLELFALEWHLGEIAEHVVRFSRAHEDTADDRRCFADLEAEVAAVLAGWS